MTTSQAPLPPPAPPLPPTTPAPPGYGWWPGWPGYWPGPPPRRSGRRRLLVGLAVVLAGALVAAAAIGGVWLAARGGGGGGGRGEAASEVDLTPSPTATAPAPSTTEPGTPPGAGTASRWVHLLEGVPDLAEHRSAPVMILDYARVRAQFGIAQPPPGATAAELGVYVSQTLPGPFAQGDPAAVRDELGFDVADFDQVVTLGPTAQDLVVLWGRFDAGRIDAAVRADPVWAPLLEERRYGSIPVYSWGEDDATSDRASQTRPGGESRRLAVLDDMLVWARSDEAVTAAIDAIGGGRSLGLDPAVRALAQAADDYAVLAGQLFADGDTYSRLRPALQPEEARIPAGLAVLTGTTMSNIGLAQLNGVAYGSEAEAAAAGAVWEAALASDPDWSQLVLIDVHGRVLVDVVALGSFSPGTVPPTGFQPAFE